jgi:putative aldouronate transport system permease protein
MGRGRTLYQKYKFYYLLMLPGLLFFIVYKYLPMGGVIFAFKDIKPIGGLSAMLASPWVGLKHFKTFFSSVFFLNVMGNTIAISLMSLCVGFPCPIILALVINEVGNAPFKKIFQTVSYLPHFLSMVIVAGLVYNVLTPSGGIINGIIELVGGESVFFLGSNDYIRWVIVLSGVWQGMGWGSIVYLAAITGIPDELYEAGIVDGANRWQRMVNITLPAIMPIISLMLILRIGDIMDAGFGRVLLLYSPAVYEKSDIIDTYIYRAGLGNFDYSFSTAVGLFKSVINLALVLFSNWFSKKAGQEGLW